MLNDLKGVPHKIVRVSRSRPIDRICIFEYRSVWMDRNWRNNRPRRRIPDAIKVDRSISTFHDSHGYFTIVVAFCINVSNSKVKMRIIMVICICVLNIFWEIKIKLYLFRLQKKKKTELIFTLLPWIYLRIIEIRLHALWNQADLV